MTWRGELFDKDENLRDVIETNSLHRMCELISAIFEEFKDLNSIHINKMEDDNG